MAFYFTVIDPRSDVIYVIPSFNNFSRWSTDNFDLCRKSIKYYMYIMTLL